MKINDNAPVVQRNEILIQASPEEVWAVLTQIDRWGEWNPGIKQPKLLSELAVGGTFTWKSKGSKIKSTIHTLDLHRSLGWTGRAFGAHAIHNWYLEPAEGGTRVRVEESMEGWLISLLKRKMNKLLADDMAFWLEQLKRRCER